MVKPKKNKQKAEREESSDAPGPSGADIHRLDEEANAEFFTEKKKKKRPNNFERAKQVFNKIQDDKRKEKEKRLEEKEKREKAIQNYLSTKKKMTNALRKKTKKGQPNLNAQMSVLLEKIQKRM